MRLSCIKSKKDKESFNFLKALGAQVYELENLEETDSKLKELVLRQ